jgi:hypothetical protein
MPDWKLLLYGGIAPLLIAAAEYLKACGFKDMPLRLMVLGMGLGAGAFVGWMSGLDRGWAIGLFLGFGYALAAMGAYKGFVALKNR